VPNPPHTLAVAGGLALIAVLGAAVVGLQIVRERRFAAVEPAEQMLYVRSPAVMTRMALSFDALAADLYWIRAVQYYGGRRLAERPDKSYDLLYPLLDLTTSLDPYFSIAYRFGALFLSEMAPGGAARPDLAVRLLEKAMAAHPTRWEYPYEVGFVYYRYGEYETAAEWFERAAGVPGAVDWLRPLAAVTLATGGDTSSSRILWRSMLESEAEWIRQTAEHRLLQLDAIDIIARLEALTADYERRFGDPPTRWDEMVRAGMLPGVPVDPAGHPYVLTPGWGDVTVSEESPMWPLPTERPA
jgi:tetratricopeptide (TPR) repeat protein